MGTGAFTQRRDPGWAGKEEPAADPCPRRLRLGPGPPQSLPNTPTRAREFLGGRLPQGSASACLPRLSPPAALLPAASASVCLSRCVACGPDAQDRARCWGSCRLSPLRPLPRSPGHGKLISSWGRCSSLPRGPGLGALSHLAASVWRVQLVSEWTGKQRTDLGTPFETLDPTSPETRMPWILSLS